MENKNSKETAASVKKTVEVDAVSIAKSYNLTPFVRISWKPWYEFEESKAAMPTKWWDIIDQTWLIEEHEICYEARDGRKLQLVDEHVIVVVEFLRNSEAFAKLFKLAMDENLVCSKSLLEVLTSVADILKMYHEFFDHYFGPESDVAQHNDD